MPERKATNWCEENGGFPYFETSAKEGTNVKEAFELIATRLVKDLMTQDPIAYA